MDFYFFLVFFFLFYFFNAAAVCFHVLNASEARWPVIEAPPAAKVIHGRMMGANGQQIKSLSLCFWGCVFSISYLGFIYKLT